MESRHKNIQLVLAFLKASFLVLLFSYDTLMTYTGTTYADVIYSYLTH